MATLATSPFLWDLIDSFCVSYVFCYCLYRSPQSLESLGAAPALGANFAGSRLFRPDQN